LSAGTIDRLWAGLIGLLSSYLGLFAREGTFASCFKLQEALNLIRQNPGAFFTAWGLSWVVSIGAGLVLGFVNLVFSWIPCIGWVIGMLLSMVSGAYITTVSAHLFGQFGTSATDSRPLLPSA